MSNKRKKVSAAVFACIIFILLAAIVLAGRFGGQRESIRDVILSDRKRKLGKDNGGNL